MKSFLILITALIVTSCTGIPDGVTVVDNFEMNRYLGTWYEIARLDHSFERGLSNISATYTLRNDGGINVANKGWNEEEKKWDSADGVGYFVDKPNMGNLKVSFYGPFYASYNIIDLDRKDYGYSIVTGPDKSYLWILARSKQLPAQTLKSLVDRLKELGYETEKLIYVKHDQQEQRL